MTMANFKSTSLQVHLKKTNKVLWAQITRNIENTFDLIPEDLSTKGLLRFHGKRFKQKATCQIFLINGKNLNVCKEVHSRDIYFAKSEHCYHLTSTDVEAVALR